MHRRAATASTTEEQQVVSHDSAQYKAGQIHTKFGRDEIIRLFTTRFPIRMQMFN
jgi:hypothetical protein